MITFPWGGAQIETYWDDMKVTQIKSPILQEDFYYPYGAVAKSVNREDAVPNKFLYQGKELVTALGIDQYDNEWRWYDPWEMLTTTLDPHADNYYDHNPNSWVANNPMNVLDPDGRDFSVKTEKDEEKKTGTITISTTVYVTGGSASQKLVDKYNKYAEKNFKDGTYEEDGITYTVKFDVNYVYSETEPEKVAEGDNVLNLRGNGDPFVSKVNGGVRNDKDGNKTFYSGNDGDIYKQDHKNANTIFHESMHFLGLTDRYEENVSQVTENGVTKQVRTSTPHKGFENDVMGTRNSGKISQVHYNNWGKAAVSKGNGVIRTRVDLDKKGVLIGGSK